MYSELKKLKTQLTSTAVKDKTDEELQLQLKFWNLSAEKAGQDYNWVLKDTCMICVIGVEYEIKRRETLETDKEDVCEKCGGDVFNVLVGDEVYRHCEDCGFGIQQ